MQKAKSADYNNIYVSSSTDMGQSWRSTLVYHAPLFTSLSNVLPSLAVDPTNAQVLYAGTTSGIYKTTNGGGSWARVYAGLPSSFETAVTSLAIDPNAPCTIYAGIEIFSTTINTNAALVVSTNCGTTMVIVSLG